MGTPNKDKMLLFHWVHLCLEGMCLCNCTSGLVPSAGKNLGPQVAVMWVRRREEGSRNMVPGKVIVKMPTV